MHIHAFHTFVPQALKEELGQKTTLVAGLRGELRKYTDLASRLEAQLHELRGGPTVVAAAHARWQAPAQAHSDAGSHASLEGIAPMSSLASESSHPMLASPPPAGSRAAAVAAADAAGEGHADGHSDAADESGAAAASGGGVDGREKTPPSTPPPARAAPREVAGVLALPPHPQAEGLEAAARTALYKEIINQAQMQVRVRMYDTLKIPAHCHGRSAVRHS